MKPSVYIMSNKKYGTLYTGVTSDLLRRVYEHKHKIRSNFTSRYQCTNLVYYKIFETIEYAILEEKRLKGGNRIKKIILIESINPNWEDLYQALL